MRMLESGRSRMSMLQSGGVKNGGVEERGQQECRGVGVKVAQVPARS